MLGPWRTGCDDTLLDEWNGMEAEMEPGAAVDRLAHEVIGAAIEVHKVLGPGFLEAVYENAMAVEFKSRGIRFDRQREIPIAYKGMMVGNGRIDYVIDDILIVELKAVEILQAIHTAQLVSYLRGMHAELGLLINFNVNILKHGIKRIAVTRPQS